MGPKRRNAASLSKHSRNPSPPAAALKPPGSSSTFDSESSEKEKFYQSLNTECERAVKVLKKKGHVKALKVLTNLCLEHENSELQKKAFMYRVQGTCCVNMAASKTIDSNAKQQLLKNAIESARTAVRLSPNSIEFAHFYANLLYYGANESDYDYEEVVKECDRALGIKEPVDPATYSMQFVIDIGLKGGSADDRVAVVKTKLQSLIKMSKESSLGNMEGNIRAENPNEIKKTDDERRKEIETKVVAARLLQQQMSESANLAGNDVNIRSSIGMDSAGPEPGERSKKAGKNVRKNMHPDDEKKRERIRSYWNSMSVDRKKDFIRIRISDLKAHFSSSLKDRSVIEVLNEALSYAQVTKVWKFWMCCCCDEKFSDPDSLGVHLHGHIEEKLLPKLQLVKMPCKLEKERADRMILDFSWKPLDLNASIEILEKHTTKVKKLEDVVEVLPYEENWPLSDDPVRAKLLERILDTLQTLMKHKCLAERHLNKVINLAVVELQGLAHDFQLLNSKIYETPLCIFLLGAPKLEKVLDFLHEISKSCGLNKSSDNSNATENSSNDDGVQQVDKNHDQENILLSEDASLLFFDEKSLPFKIPLSSCDDAIIDEAASAHICYKNGLEVFDSNATLLSWVFTGLPSDEHLVSWTYVRQGKAQEGQEILQSMEKDFHQMHEKQKELVSYLEELQNLECLCLEEDKKRLNNEADYVRQSFETVLKKRREVLTENDNDNSTKFKLDAIAHLLKDLFVLENLVGHDWGINDVDTHIESEIKRGKERVDTEFCKIDARILQTRSRMEQLEIELEPVLSYDFQYILISIVKSFLRACLEDLAEKDAIKESDAAMDALLAMESKKGTVGTGSGNPKLVHERTKDKKKKKSKKNPNNKTPKFAISSESSNDQSADNMILPPSAHDEQGPGSGIDDDDALRFLTKELNVALRLHQEYDDSKIQEEHDDALKPQEDENKHKMELKAEEIRNSEETLEYQRQLENEAKAKHQHERISQASTEKEEPTAVSDVHLEHSDVLDKDAAKHSTDHMKIPRMKI